MKIKFKEINFFNEPFPHIISTTDIHLNYELIEDLIASKSIDHFRVTNNIDFQKKELRSDSGLLGNLLSAIQTDEIKKICEDSFNIKNLISDPNFDGGGLTITELNGYLKYHCDFPYSNEVNAYRVINTLLYLSDSALEGGDLHLLDPISLTVEKIIKLDFGLFVAFPTSKNTPHGFSRIKKGRRISINSYFYSDRPLDDRTEPSKTDWIKIN